MLLRRFGLQDAANYAQLLSIPLAVVPLTVARWVWFHRAPAPVVAEPAAPAPVEQLLELGDLAPIGATLATGALALGVRQAIPLTDHGDGLDEDLPRFVPRVAETRLRRALRRGARFGGLYVLVGDSAVGKTRTLYEAVTTELADFAVFAPDPGDGGSVNELAHRTDELPPLVVWLDQLHRFVDGPYLRAGDTAIEPKTIRRLLAADTPVIVLGTLWPEHLRELLAVDDAVDDGAGALRALRHPAAGEILDDPRCTTLAVESFTDADRATANELRDTDPRLAEALAHPRYGLTEVLAGVPTLMRRYAEATDGLRALVHAAVDARRLGVVSPLTATCLREAGRAHLRDVHTDDRWFADALDLLDLSAVFVPVPAPDRLGVVGYDLAGYLAQHVLRDRRREPVPELVWTVLAAETTDEADLARLADAATHRHIHRVAIPLWCRLAAAGHAGATTRLVDVFTQWGNTRQLKKIGPPFDQQAAQALRRLAGRGEPVVTALAEYEPTGTNVLAVDTPLIAIAADRTLWRLTDLLAENGHHQLLVDLAAAGDQHAAVLLAKIAAADGSTEDAVALLGPGVVLGDHESVRALASIQYQQQDFAAAADLVEPYAEEGEGWAMHLLRAIKVAARDVDWLTVSAAAGDPRSGRALVRMCYLDRDIQALARHALDDDEFAALLLDRMWYERGDLPALRTRAATGNHYAAWLLGTALIERDDIDGLVDVVAERVPVVPGMLAALLHGRGDTATLERLTDPACTIALALSRARRCTDPAELLTAVPRVFDQVPALFDIRSMRALTTELRRRLHEAEPENDKQLLLARASAEAAPTFQHPALTHLLARQHDIESLTWLLSIGRGWAAPPLADLHLERGDVDAAIAVLTVAADDGNPQAAGGLADLLYLHDRPDELRARADAGDHHAAARFAAVLQFAEDGVEELVDRAGAGDAYALDAVLDHLDSPEDRATAIDLLTPWVAAGSAGAAHRLSALHERDGDLDAAVRVLGPFAADGDLDAARRITELTYVRGDLATLRDLADAGDRHAAQRIASALFENGDTAGLAREMAADNTDDAARHLIELHRSTTRKGHIHSLAPTGAPDQDDWHPPG
jgi:hypothetical protein